MLFLFIPLTPPLGDLYITLTVFFGIYPAVAIDAVSYAASGLIFNTSDFILDSSRA